MRIGIRAFSEYRSWEAMRDRCSNPKSKDWRLYGARGITVCARWADSYENFLADMGRKPSVLHSLDRIDNDGNYEPGNCRWATPREQQLNTRRIRKRIGPLLANCQFFSKRWGVAA